MQCTATRTQMYAVCASVRARRGALLIRDRHKHRARARQAPQTSLRGLRKLECVASGGPGPAAHHPRVCATRGPEAAALRPGHIPSALGPMAHAPMKAATSPRWASFRGEEVLLAALALYIAILSVWPLLRLFAEALSPGRDGEVLGVLLGQWRSLATRRALFNTVEASMLATLLSVAIGTGVAFVLGLTDVRGKPALTFAALLPLLVPSQITALAWIELTGASSAILSPLGLAPEPV